MARAATTTFGSRWKLFVSDLVIMEMTAPTLFAPKKRFVSTKTGTMSRFAILSSFLLALVGLETMANCQNIPPKKRDWPVYGGSQENNHFSPLAQINRQNVKNLVVAWSFDTDESGGLETSPLIVDGNLYAYSPSQKIIALDAATGRLLWKFDPQLRATQPSRGLAYWTDGEKPRLLAGVMNFVYALDAKTGTPIPDFGKDGRVDLRENLRGNPAEQTIYLTTPGIIYKDLLIVGGRNLETLPTSPGYIRAYDVHDGRLRWTFHTIPQPGEFGYDTWPKDAWETSGGANNWAGMALDVQRGIVYAPTGSAAFDFYGGDRVGDDLFANSLIALNAQTGERIWHFQAVRHDLWDRDFPSPPALLKVRRDGKTVDAVAQTTKHGYVYVFDRTNGEPLFPIRYREYPASSVPGEVTASQQPLPTTPLPFARQMLTQDMLTNRTPAAHAAALESFRKFRSEGQFVPLSVGVDTVVFPGFDGGAEWGGPAVDVGTGILYVNANEMAWTGALAKNSGDNSPRSLYLDQCAVCHGDDRKGSPPEYPSLLGLRERLTQREASETIRHGKGRMPGFSNFTEDQLFAIIGYVMTGSANQTLATEIPEMNYRFTGYHKFLDPDGYPAVAPPWGTLSAINLNSGEYVWKINLGEYPELAAKGMTNTGSENYGGPIVTGGGLVFIGATNFDKKFRAFDKSTGKLLWEATLPFAGNATPATYAVRGRQYVVIAAGGGKNLNAASGGLYVAFALPKNARRAAALLGRVEPHTFECFAGRVDAVIAEGRSSH
jgi:quinoprotein glucose dehydrogenase